MGITERVVLSLIAIGVIATLIWLKRALASYPQDPALFSPAAQVERDLRHPPPRRSLAGTGARSSLGRCGFCSTACGSTRSS